MQRFIKTIKRARFYLFFVFCTSFCHTDLIDLEKFIPGIKLDIKYATIDNFTHQIVYPMAKAYLVKHAAEALKKAQEDFTAMRDAAGNLLGYELVIKDAYRPLSVQKKFWELVPDERYVANPAKGSRHNRGCAVDVTLMQCGKEVEMPTDFDDFTDKAHRNYMGCSQKAQRNRELLERIMCKYGFIGLPTEWWHFDYIDSQKYAILDIDFEKLAC